MTTTATPSWWMLLVLLLVSTENTFCFSPSSLQIRPVGFSSQMVWRRRITTTGPAKFLSRRASGSSATFTNGDDEVDTAQDDWSEEGVRPDMKYLPRNVMRQNQHFVAIRAAAGPALTQDVYVRAPDSSTFWFVGKVARVSDITSEQVVARQWPLIERHAANLRPLELYPHRGRLEIWTAPGDSEMEVAYNRPDTLLTKMSRQVEGADSLKNNLMGFQGEIYERGEEGFRTWRLEDGRPARPMVQSANNDRPPDDEFRAPTDEEMEKISQALEGKDINDLYEEQQRRKGMTS